MRCIMIKLHPYLVVNIELRRAQYEGNVFIVLLLDLDNLLSLIPFLSLVGELVVLPLVLSVLLVLANAAASLI